MLLLLHRRRNRRGAVGGFLNTDVNYLRHRARCALPYVRGNLNYGVSERKKPGASEVRVDRASGREGGKEKRAKGREEARRLFISRYTLPKPFNRGCSPLCFFFPFFFSRP